MQMPPRRSSRQPFLAAWGVALLLLAAVCQAQDPSGERFSSEYGETDFANPAWRFRADHVSWWAKGNPLPALVTTSPPGTPISDAGVLGTPNAAVLYGDEDIGNGVRSGFRGTLTRWSDNNMSRGVEITFDYIGDVTSRDDFAADSLGLPILSRPFLNANTLAEDAELVAFPGQLRGRVDVISSSNGYAGEVLLRQQLGISDLGWLDVLGGYRYFRWRESLAVREDLVSTNPGGLIPLGSRFQVFDDFATENNFHGGEIGVNAAYGRGIFTVELLAKVALGSLRRETFIAGRTTTTIPGLPPTTEAGGLLALPTNIGTRIDSEFGVLPEFGVQARTQLTPRLSSYLGYSLILLNGVARTGEQIDRLVNPSQLGGQPLAGSARPSPTLGDNDFWLQSVNAGLEFSW